MAIRKYFAALWALWWAFGCVLPAFAQTGPGFTAINPGTPIAVTTSGVTGTLPPGTSVMATNVGAQTAYCQLGAAATTSSQPLTAGTSFQFQVPSTATQLTCITSTGTTTVNVVGGSGQGVVGNVGLPASQTQGGVTVANLVCDGVTDNAALLNAYLTTAAAGNATTVYFPPAANPCMFSSNVTVPSGISALWANPNSVILKAKAGNVSSPLLLSIANVSNVLVYGLTFDGGGIAFGSANNVNTVFTASNVIFDHVILQNTNGIGLIFSTSVSSSGIQNSAINNVGATATKQGVAFSSGTVANNHDNFAISNSFNVTGLDAISIASQHNFVAANNRIKSAGAAGIFASGNDTLTIVGNNVIGSVGNGIDTASNTDVVITGNTSRYNGSSGIGDAYTINSTITGNVSTNNNQAAGGSNGGLFLSGTTTALTNVTITGNNFSDDQNLVNTTCNGTVTAASTTCTLASSARLNPGSQLTIAGVGVASANLVVTLVSVTTAGVITWTPATTTQQIAPAVTGVPTQPFGIYQQAGGTVTNVFVDDSNQMSGNVTGQFGGNITSYANTPGAVSLFGTGSDGAVSISSGTTTLTRDMNYTNLTISGTGVLKPAGWRIFVNGVLDISAAPAGAITTVQGTGGNASGQTAGTFNGPNIGWGGLVGISGGGAGGAGGAAGLVGSNAPANSNAQVTTGNGGQTGAGGNGGTSGVHAGGTGAVQGKPSFPPNSAMVAFPTPWSGQFTYGLANAGNTWLNVLWPSYSAGGGGGGGADASNAGGGGGASATEPYGIAIYARQIVRGSNATAGIITAAGSTGGAGANGVAGTAGGGGGAGGTGGAWIYIVAGSMTGSTITNAMDVSGGAGGAGGNGLSTGTGGTGGTGGGCGGTQVVVLVPASFTQSTGWNTAGSAGNAPTGGGSNPTGGTGGGGTAKQVNL